MCGCLLAGHNEHGWKVHGKLFLVGLGSARRDPKGEEYPNTRRTPYPNGWWWWYRLVISHHIVPFRQILKNGRATHDQTAAFALLSISCGR